MEVAVGAVIGGSMSQRQLRNTPCHRATLQK